MIRLGGRRFLSQTTRRSVSFFRGRRRWHCGIEHFHILGRAHQVLRHEEVAGKMLVIPSPRHYHRHEV